ncbi:uncharacterized protein MELLADRAFT_116341 [Melampsora larici-populina 98AG31]|uniref:SigF-like NTF2-like domain-containing protein n=1 Tax=Melampsora larici-populina (strain 98AG31 / pathotype 3-4-7) TaxID=747676 RepID=F4RK80_MELLP|nr:uncharacterized protein MELLADRAFT_116341 [Melampsora larici-populina 98AG31]EGG07052.1 hypothetical protein MELLADRAFT_116341 [Melampsora larici-populina 98AG31]
MDNPVAEVEEVIRSVTEPYPASVLAANVEKYFTEDAVLRHPFLVAKGREAIKGIYKIVRVQTVNQKIDFHAVMFNEDKTQITIDLTEHMNTRLCSYRCSRVSIRLLVRLHLVQGTDRKYRIRKQEDNFSSDTGVVGILLPFMPGFSLLGSLVRVLIGFGIGKIGRFLLSRGWLGQ